MKFTLAFSTTNATFVPEYMQITINQISHLICKVLLWFSFLSIKSTSDLINKLCQAWCDPVGVKTYSYISPLCITLENKDVKK